MFVRPHAESSPIPSGTGESCNYGGHKDLLRQALRNRGEISKEAEGISSSLILCGHTHLPRRIDLQDGRSVVNPGSVGCPGYDNDFPVYHVMQTGTSAACYAILEKHKQGWLTTFRNVPYDTGRMVQMARDAGRMEWANALATGWVE